MVEKLAKYDTHVNASHLLHPGFLLSLYFDPEDVGGIFLRYVG
jgi:hypothetical protein